MNSGDFVGLISVVMVFGIPMLAIWTSHQRKMIEMKLRLREQTGNVSTTDIDSLRQEVRALRETTMQYDLSFDTALQRMEQRVEQLERRALAPAAEAGMVNTINTQR